MTQAVSKATGMEAGPPISSWLSFSHRAFALLWTATLISNVGTWMHDVGAGWFMTTLSPSPAIVALVQAATTLPFFLFALFAGAIPFSAGKEPRCLSKMQRRPREAR